MKRYIPLLNIVLVLSLLVAACAPKPTPTPTPKPTPKPTVVKTVVVEKEVVKEVPVEVTKVVEMEEEEIAYPDTLIYAAEREPRTLDPAVDSSGIEGEVIFNVYETLIFWDGEDPNRFVPQLAEHWEVSEDGLTYTFHIREGVGFHHDGTLTPEDVEYSFERAMIRDQAARFRIFESLFGVFSMDELVAQYGDYEACEKVKKAVEVEGNTVVFKLSAPFAPFLQIIAHPSGSIVDKEWVRDALGGWPGTCDDWKSWSWQASPLDSTMNGTGPFMLEEWIPEGEITLRRNEDYWKEPAALERFKILFIPEGLTRIAVLRAEEADIIDVPTEYQDEMDPLIEEGTVFAYKGLPMPVQRVAFFNPDISEDSPYIGSAKLDGEGIPPDFFSDVNVRTAFSYSFGWDEFITEVYHGEAQQSTGPVPEGVFDLNFDNPVYTNDPEQAEYYFRLVLDGKVWENGFRLTIPCRDDWRKVAAEILKYNIEGLNSKFSIDIVTVPSAVYFDSFSNNLMPIFMSGWIQDYHDPHSWVYPFMHSKGYFGHQGVNKPEWDAMIEEAVRTFDWEQRNEIYRTLQWEAHYEAMAIFLSQPFGSYYYRSWVQGWYYNPAYPMGSSGIFAWLYKKAKPAVEFVARYGSEAYDAVSKYGPKAVNAALAYGKDTLDAILEYGKDALDMICTYGKGAVEAGRLAREVANLLSQIETKAKEEKAEKLYGEVVTLAMLVAAQQQKVRTAEEMTAIASGMPKPIADWAKNAMSAYGGVTMGADKVGLAPGESLGLGGCQAIFKRGEELAKQELRELTRSLYSKWDEMWKAYKAIGRLPPSIPDVGFLGPP